MIPPIVDPGWPKAGGVQVAFGDDATALAVRFADLLLDDAGGVGAPSAAPLPSAGRITDIPVPGPEWPSVMVAERQEAPYARLFNQDGFFGHAAAAPESGPFPRPSTAARALESGERVAACAGFSPLPMVPHPHVDWARALPPQDAPAPAPVSPTISESAPRPASTTARTHAPIDGPAKARQVETRPGNRRVARAAFSRLPLARPAATVAVAVHAVAHGMEVAAQIAGLGDLERNRLADEIAAMLSAHGFAPARIAIIAAAATAQKEHR